MDFDGQCKPEGPDCSAAESGTVERVFAADESYSNQSVVDGCVYEWGYDGHPDVDGEGNNCIVEDDGSLRCYFSASPTGESAEDCQGEGGSCTDPLEESTPVSDPLTADEQTSTSTETNADGSVETTTETASQVNPDGSTTQTETTTREIKDSAGEVLETHVITETTQQAANGAQTWTRTTEVYDANDNLIDTETETSSQEQPTETASSGQVADEQEQAAEEEANQPAGDCDPTELDYLECMGYTEDVAEGEGDAIVGSAESAGEDALINLESDYITDIDSHISSNPMDGIQETGFLQNLWESVVPQPATCTAIELNFPMFTGTIECQRFEQLKVYLGYALAVLTIFSIIGIALNPIETKV